MKAYVIKEGDWLVFFTQPLVYHVYYKCPRATKLDMEEFLNKQIILARQDILKFGRRAPAW